MFLADKLPRGVAPAELDPIELGAQAAAGEPTDPDAPGAPERPLVTLLSALLATVQAKEHEAQEQQRRAAQIYADAQRDALTGVGNRAAWERALSREERRCRRYGHPAAVILVDLDELKATNDTAGHVAGDALLRRAAQALVSSTRRPDLVARLGGDEFAVLALDCDAKGLAVLEQRIRAALEAAQVRASIGTAVRNDTDGLTGALIRADQAMYREKRHKPH